MTLAVTMISVEEAQRLVLEHTAFLPAVDVPLADALGCVLDEEITSDVDSPPHDKSVVDGYAVKSADMAAGEAWLTLLEEVTAGELPTRSVGNGQTTRIMTGAPIPEGADSVVMVERCSEVDGRLPNCRVRLVQPDVRAGQNIVPRAASMAKGDLVLARGTRIRPAEVGLLAEVGRAKVRVMSKPTVAILSTGNELVPHDAVPGPGQIRNSNGPMLAACVKKAGGEPWELPIARDERKHLRDLVARGLEANILVLSGGVSAGVLDLVPEVLKSFGVREVFHKVNLKPGKPLWFGARLEKVDNFVGVRLVFGLPGNPVSSLVCFELFVRPAMNRLLELTTVEPTRLRAALSKDFLHQGSRPTYHPAWLEGTGDNASVQPLSWKGSGDLRTLCVANALAVFPPGDCQHRTGDVIDVIVLD